jgi:hypothetical protein
LPRPARSERCQVKVGARKQRHVKAVSSSPTHRSLIPNHESGVASGISGATDRSRWISINSIPRRAQPVRSSHWIQPSECSDPATANASVKRMLCHFARQFLNMKLE